MTQMAQRKAETEDKGKVTKRIEAKEDAQPQHDEGHFTASLDLGHLNTNTVGRLQRTIGNKATRQLIQRQYKGEDEVVKGIPSPGGPVPTPYPNQGNQGNQGSMIKMTKKKAVTGSSQIGSSLGDEAGTLKGTVSNTNMNKGASSFAPGMDPATGPPAFAAGKIHSEQGGKIDLGGEGLQEGKFSGGGSQTSKLGDYENKFEG
jgi:hypothetical protein